MFVNPAPLPMIAPTNLLLTLVSEATPLKVFEPKKVWLPLSNGTLEERRASAKVPNARLAALSVVKPMPFPTKAPLNLLLTLVIEATPLKMLEAEKVWLVLSRGTLADKRASASVPETSVPSATAAGVQSVPL